MGTTTTLGIDISTGDSVSNLQKTTDEMGNLLEKYTALMEKAGRADEVFATVSKAVGLHTQNMIRSSEDLHKAAQDAAQGAVAKTRDMTIRQLSNTMSGQFKGLAEELKNSLSPIPTVVKSVATELNNMTVLVNNTLGGIKVHIEDIKEAYGDVDALLGKLAAKMPKTTPKDPPKPKETPINDGFGSDEIPRKDIFNKAAGVVLRDEEDTLNAIYKVKAATDGLKKSIAELSKTPLNLNAEDIQSYDNILSRIKQGTAELKTANIDMSGDAGRAMAELQEDITKTADSYKLLQKNSLLAKKELEAQRIQQHTGIKVIDADEAKSEIAGVSLYLKTLKNEMSKDWFNAESALAEMQNIKEALQDITTRTRTYGISTGQELKAAESQYKALLPVIKEIVSEQDKAAKIEAQRNAKIQSAVEYSDLMAAIEAEKEAARLKEDSEKRLAALQANRIQGIKKEELAASKEVAKAKIDDEKKVYETRLSLAIKEAGGFADNKVGVETNLNAVNTAMATTEQLLENINKVGSEQLPLFKSMENLRNHIDDLKEMESSIRKIASAAQISDKELAARLTAQADLLKKQRETIFMVAKGYDPTNLNAGVISNTSAIQTEQERDLLAEIYSLTGKVIAAREKLSNSKGKPKDTDEAKKELSGLEQEYHRLREAQRIFTEGMKNIGISGSAGVSNIQNSMSDLGRKMSSFQGTIKSTENSFKNMWGAFTIGLGKFMLFYHTASIVTGWVSSITAGMYNFGKSFAETGSKLITFEKQVKDIFGGSQEFTNREMARLKQLSDYYGVVTTDIAKYYATITKQLKEMGANDDFSRVFKENAIAAIRGAGLGASETENVFRALQQLLSKNQPAMEEITQQLSEHLGTISIYMSQYLGMIEKDGKKVYAAFANIRDVVDLKDAVSKGKVAMNDFVAAVTYGLGKIGEQAKNSITSYESEVSRLTNAWNEVQTSMMKGTAGFYLSETLREVTDMVKDPEFQSSLVDAVGHITRMVAAFTKMAVFTLPKLLEGVTEVLNKIPGIDAYKPTANANPALKEAYLRTQFNTEYQYTDRASQETKDNDYQSFYSREKNSYNKEIGQLYSSGSLQAFKDGFAYFEDGVLKMSQNSEEALKHQKEMDTNNVADLRANVTDPMHDYIESGKASWGEALGLLSQAVSLRAKELGDYSVMSQVASNYGSYAPNYGISSTEWPTKPPEVQGPTTKALLGMDTGLAGKVNKPSEADIKKVADMDRAFRAEMERLDGAISAAQAGGNWAEKIQKVANQADVKNITDEKFNPEQEAQLAIKRGQAQAAMQTQLYGEAMQSLENIDAEIASRIAGGNLKNELKTQYEDIIKWRITTINKLKKEFAGLPGVDLEKRYADIQKAVERASEQALTQGNTPMEVIAKAEKKAGQGRVDAWESTNAELVKQTEKFSQIQIQHQWDLMEVQDNISGLRAEKEKQRTDEATKAVKDQFKNTGLIDEIANIKKIIQDESVSQNNKELFGSIFDADKIEETQLAAEKLASQMRALEQAGKATGAAYKELGRLQQDQIDIAKEAAIENSSSMEEYLSRKMTHDYGLDNNDVVATKKRYEDMYNVIESGANDMGNTVKSSFIDAFSGTLDSWNDVWSSIKQTFLKTLASMIWEAKARPITIGLISGLTGMGNISSAFAGDKEGGALAGSVAGMFSDGKGGLFSSLAKLPEKIDDFGKSVLSFGDSVKLSDGLMAGGLGYGIGTMFGGTQGGMGGAFGGAVGNLIGQGMSKTVAAAFGETLGAMAPGIGQVIGTTAGVLIGAAFASEKVTSKGIEITIGEGGVLTAKNYTNYKSAGLFGGGQRTEYKPSDRSTVNYLSNEVDKLTNSLEKAFKNIGIGTTAEGYVAKAEKIDLRQDPEEAIKAWLNKTTANIADYMVGESGVLVGFESLKNYGESSADAVTRLSDALFEFKDAALEANVGISKLSGGLKGLDLVSYTAQFTEVLGSTENVRDFFQIIEEFGGYAGGEGLSNVADLTEALKASFESIKNTNQGQGSNPYLSTLKFRQGNLQSNVNDALSRITEVSDRRTIWGKFIDVTDDGAVVINKFVDQITGAVTDIDTWAAGKKTRQDEWTVLQTIIKDYGIQVKELAEVNNQIVQEMTTPTKQQPSIIPESSTFWTDFDKMQGSLTPELAGVWYEAAKLAKELYDVRQAAKEAAQESRELRNEYFQQNLSIAKASKYLKLSSQGILNVAMDAQQLNKNDLPAWFEETGNSLLYNLVPGLKGFNLEGETALETFNRLGNIMIEISDAVGVTGISLSELSGGLSGIDLAAFGQELVNVFGSSSLVIDALARFNTNANTPEEQKTFGADYWKKQAVDRIGELKDSFPKADFVNFWDEYKEVMKKGLSPEQLYQWDYAAQAMENMATAAGEAANAVDDLADYLQGIKDKIAAFGMSDTELFLRDLEKEQAGMRKDITAKGGSPEDLAIVDTYGIEAIKNRLGDLMDGIVESTESLTKTETEVWFNQLVKKYDESTKAAILLGASEEQLAAIRENGYAQLYAKQEEFLAEAEKGLRQSGMTEYEKFVEDTTEAMNKSLAALGVLMASEEQLAVVRNYAGQQIKDKLSEVLDGISESVDVYGMTAYDKQLKLITEDTQKQIAAITVLKGSEEDLAIVRQNEANQIAELQKAHTDYIDSIQEKISALGQTETQGFLSGLMKEAKEMREQIKDLGGAGADTSIVDAYVSLSISQRINDTLDNVRDSIKNLSMTELEYQIYELKKTTQESITALNDLGASEGAIALIRQEAALKAKAIIKSAAEAYISSYDAQLSKIQELESERQALQDAVDEARNNYIDAIQAEIDKKQEAIDKLQENVNGLKDFIKSIDELKATMAMDAGFLSPLEKAGAAMANFQKIADKAMAGDTDARGQLSSAATAAASSAKESMGYQQYLMTFARIYGKLNEAQDKAKKELTPQEKELQMAIESRDSLQLIVDKLKAEADTTLSMAEAAQAYQNAQAALATSGLDNQIKYLQDEANRHTETIDVLRKQYDTTLSLDAAAKQYFKTTSDLMATTTLSTEILGSLEEVQQYFKTVADLRTVTTPDTEALVALAEVSKDSKKLLSASNELLLASKKIADKSFDKMDELLYFTREDSKKLYNFLYAAIYKDYRGYYTHPSEDGLSTETDVGIKVIVSNAQVRDGVLAALLTENIPDEAGEFPANSIIGFLANLQKTITNVFLQPNEAMLIEDTEDPAFIPETAIIKLLGGSTGGTGSSTDFITALRTANNFTDDTDPENPIVPETSVVGLLNGIKGCACECQCEGGSTGGITCDLYGETSDCWYVSNLTEADLIDDTTGMATKTTAKLFSTVMGAVAYSVGAIRYNPLFMYIPFIQEDPDCINGSFFALATEGGDIRIRYRKLYLTEYTAAETVTVVPLLSLAGDGSTVMMVEGGGRLSFAEAVGVALYLYGPTLSVDQLSLSGSESGSRDPAFTVNGEENPAYLQASEFCLCFTNSSVKYAIAVSPPYCS